MCFVVRWVTVEMKEKRIFEQKSETTVSQTWFKQQTSSFYRALFWVMPPALGGPGRPLTPSAAVGRVPSSGPLFKILTVRNRQNKIDFKNGPYDFPNFLHAAPYGQYKNKSLLVFCPKPPGKCFFRHFFDPNLHFFANFGSFGQKNGISSTQLDLQVRACGKNIQRQKKWAIVKGFWTNWRWLMIISKNANFRWKTWKFYFLPIISR